VLGSALAFRLFLFFIPMVLTIVGITGLLRGRIRPDQAVDAVGVSGTMSDQIRSALAQSQGTAWTALIIGLFGLLWAGRSLARVLLASAAIAWLIPVQGAKTTVRVIGAVVALMAGIGVLMGVANRIREATGTAIGGLSMIAVAGFYMVLWLLVLLTLPRQRSDPSSLIPGAVIVGATLGAMQAFTQLYLPGQLDRASDVYGSIGVATVTMGWFFFAGRVMVLANSLNAVIYEKFGSIAQFIFSLPVLRIIPRRWPRLGEFFGVHRTDEPGDGPSATPGERTDPPAEA
jgi:membrane protein